MQMEKLVEWNSHQYQLISLSPKSHTVSPHFVKFVFDKENLSSHLIHLLWECIVPEVRDGPKRRSKVTEWPVRDRSLDVKLS